MRGSRQGDLTGWHRARLLVSKAVGAHLPTERPRKSCSSHKESMFWNLRDFAATRIQGARAMPSRRSRLSQSWPVTEGGNAVIQPGGGVHTGGGGLTCRLAPWEGGSCSVPALSHREGKPKDYRISPLWVPAAPELFKCAGSIIQDDELACAVRVCS